MVGREVDVARLILGGNSLESSRGNKGIFMLYVVLPDLSQYKSGLEWKRTIR